MYYETSCVFYISEPLAAGLSCVFYIPEPLPAGDAYTLDTWFRDSWDNLQSTVLIPKLSCYRTYKTLRISLNTF